MRKMTGLMLAVMFIPYCLQAQYNHNYKAPSTATKDSNNAVLSRLDFSNKQDSLDATHGMIKVWYDLKIVGINNTPVWNMGPFKFLEENSAPTTVNPSLWREARLNYTPGVFKVQDSIYQVRGFDNSNMTFIKGKKGWVVIDPLAANETASAALDSINSILKITGDYRKVSAVIFTHSHEDHYGGISGISNSFFPDTKIYAPQGFLEHAISENTIAGNVMGRRAAYMYGSLLPKNKNALVDAGLGKALSAGTISIMDNSISINSGILKPETDTIDGVITKFWITPGAEAPVEMMFYFPQLKALCASEEVTHTMHNVYSLRGTRVRDALGWSKFIDSTLAIYGHSAQVMFASHHWPVWGDTAISKLLLVQRDMYRYIHDQTMRWANQGYTPLEIADSIRLPKSLDTIFANRGYYGTLNHNAKSVYDYYLGGWFDGNPAHLHPLPPAAAGKRYIKFMGGRDSVIRKAQESFDEGDYRWVATVLNHLIFADPADSIARFFLADTYEQLGYQAESGPWRNFYLTGAQELRFPLVKDSLPQIYPSDEVLNTMSLSQYFDFLAIHLIAEKVPDTTAFFFKIQLNEVATPVILTLENKTVNYQIQPSGSHHKQPHAAPVVRAVPTLDATISLPRNVMDTIIQYGPTLGQQAMTRAIIARKATIEGNSKSWYKFISFLDKFNFWFNIVTP